MNQTIITILLIALAFSLIYHDQKNDQLNEQEQWINETEQRIEGLESASRVIQKQCIELLYPGKTNGI